MADPTPPEMTSDPNVLPAGNAFEFRSAVAVPFNEDDIFSFGFTPAFDGKISQAEYLPLDRLAGGELNIFLRSFRALSLHAGMRNTLARVSQELPEAGLNREQSLVMGWMVIDLVCNTLEDLSLKFAVQYSLDKAAELPFPMSVLHCWCISEGADYFLKDLLPLSRAEGGTGLLEDHEAAEKAATHLRQLTGLYRTLFSGVANPYLNLKEWGKPMRDYIREREKKS